MMICCFFILMPPKVRNHIIHDVYRLIVVVFSWLATPHPIQIRMVDVGATAKFQSKPRLHHSPTLTKTRASGGGFYLTKLNRRLLPKDAWYEIGKVF